MIIIQGHLYSVLDLAEYLSMMISLNITLISFPPKNY